MLSIISARKQVIVGQCKCNGIQRHSKPQDQLRCLGYLSCAARTTTGMILLLSRILTTCQSAPHYLCVGCSLHRLKVITASACHWPWLDAMGLCGCHSTCSTTAGQQQQLLPPAALPPPPAGTPGPPSWFRGLWGLRHSDGQRRHWPPCQLRPCRPGSPAACLQVQKGACQDRTAALQAG